MPDLEKKVKKPPTNLKKPTLAQSTSSNNDAINNNTRINDENKQQDALSNKNLVESKTSKKDANKINNDAKNNSKEVLIEKEDKKQNNKKIQKNADKTPKDKAKNGKKKRVFLTIAICLILVIGIVVAILLLGGKKNTDRLLTPKFEVLDLANETLIRVEAVEGAKGYKYFVYDENLNEIFSQAINEDYLELASLLKQSGKYYVRVQTLGAEENQNSKISDYVEYVKYNPLKVSNFYVNGLDVEYGDDGNIKYNINENFDDDFISWQSVKEAEMYYVCYGANVEDAELLMYEIENTEGTITFNLQNIFENGVGEYRVSVVAIAKENSYYANTNFLCNEQDLITVVYTAKLDSPINVAYNVESETLTFRYYYVPMFDGEFEILIKYKSEQKNYILKGDKLTQNGNLYSVFLGEINSGEVMSISIRALGGNFLYDSNYVLASML